MNFKAFDVELSYKFRDNFKEFFSGFCLKDSTVK